MRISAALVFLITAIVAGAACADPLILRIPVRDGAPKIKLQATCVILLPQLPIDPANWDAHRCGKALMEIGIRAVSHSERAGAEGNLRQAWLDALVIDVPPIEACGNSVVEPMHGETCDDGNVVNGDGCDELCVSE